MIQIYKSVNNPIPSNHYVIYDNKIGNGCIIIDPGSKDITSILSFLSSNKLTPTYILLTHEHFDHCWGVDKIKNIYPDAKLVCTKECSIAIQNKKLNYSVFYEQPGFDLKEADIILDRINWALFWDKYQILFYPAKGHTKSGVIIHIGAYLFTGDELIKGVKTVTKLKTGSHEKLKESFDFLENMKGKNYMIFPGHGDSFLLDEYNLQIT